MEQADFKMKPIRKKQMRLDGALGKLVQNVTRRWLMGIRETNPAILDMFRGTEQLPYRHLLAWSGEFAGKYLTCAVQICRMTGDRELRRYLEGLVAELLSLQQPNGYLGPFPRAHQLTGTMEPVHYAFDGGSKPETFDTWDSWGHYHLMTGLLLWHDYTGDEAAFSAVLRIAGLFMESFYTDGKPALVSTRSEEMNLSVLHSFACLYQRTGEEKYLRFAERVVADLAVPPAGDYLRQGLAGTDFFKMPKPRWESLHPIQGLLEMYSATGDDGYRRAVENIWWSILSTDVHNTGGFSTWEMAVGSPYREGPVETCCVIAYMALTLDMLRLTGNSIVADVLELATLNSSMGSFSPSGRWSTYDTPMEGYKRANYHSIGFQCRPGSPDLNCCSVNAPRAFGMLDDWAYMLEGDTLAVNYYGEHSVSIDTPGGCLRLRQQTAYPAEGTVRIVLEQVPQGELKLALRIPFWSENTRLTVGGEEIAVRAGSYVRLCRTFTAGESILLKLDMSLRAWAGEERMAGKASLFYGPLVLCADSYYDGRLNVEQLPKLRAESLKLLRVEPSGFAGSTFTLECGGETLTLCDLYTAGSSGSAYTTWLPMTGIAPKPFARSNPFRLQKVGV